MEMKRESRIAKTVNKNHGLMSWTSSITNSIINAAGLFAEFIAGIV
jgi:hypothetical protein